jgi:hypothetical protein
MTWNKKYIFCSSVNQRNDCVICFQGRPVLKFPSSLLIWIFCSFRTASEYEELLEACGSFEGIHDGIKAEVYTVDDVTAVQEPQTVVQSAQFDDLVNE